MKTFIITGVFALLPFYFVNAAADYYLKLDGVEGEVKASSSPSPTPAGDRNQSTITTATPTASPKSNTGTIATPTAEPQEGGKVEFEWKVEEGESLETTGVEPDEIDFMDDGEPLTPDFGILLGGGSDDEEEANENREELSKILLEGMQESDKPVETLSINYEELKTEVKQDVKLFGLFPISATATVEIDAEEKVTVRFPWWAFLASGKNSDELGQKIFTNLSNVLKTKHDTIKNSINNVR